MGYDIRLRFVEKPGHSRSASLTREDKFYVETIAIIEVGKFPELYNLFEKKGYITDCYFYADDGDTEVFEDRYGDELQELPLEVLKTFCDELARAGEDYRRFLVLKSIVDSFVEHKEKWRNIYVLKYGHLKIIEKISKNNRQMVVFVKEIYYNIHNTTQREAVMQNSTRKIVYVKQSTAPVNFMLRERSVCIQ